MLCLMVRRDGKVLVEIPPSTEARTMTVTFVEMRQGGAKLGFDAPREIGIVRDDAKVKERQGANSPARVAQVKRMVGRVMEVG